MQLIPFGMSGETLPPEDSYVQGDQVEVHGTDSVCATRVSTAFEIINGRRMPIWLELEELTGMHNIRQPTWFARVELVMQHTPDGKHAPTPVPRIVELGFDTHPDGPELRTADLSRARSAAYNFYAAFCAEIDSDGNPIYRKSVVEERAIRDFVEAQHTGRQRLTTGDYLRAAQIYRDNFDGTPTGAVAKEFGVKVRQAGNIVAECRRRGFLPPTKQGKKQA